MTCIKLTLKYFTPIKMIQKLIRVLLQNRSLISAQLSRFVIFTDFLRYLMVENHFSQLQMGITYGRWASGIFSFLPNGRSH